VSLAKFLSYSDWLIRRNVLSFREKRRLIGEEALAAVRFSHTRALVPKWSIPQVTRSPDATLQSVKRFLGKDLQEAKEELEFLPYELEDLGEYVGIKVNSSGGEVSFRPEQVDLSQNCMKISTLLTQFRCQKATAMMLKQLRLYTELHFGDGMPLQGCVLAVKKYKSMSSSWLFFLGTRMLYPQTTSRNRRCGSHCWPSRAWCDWWCYCR